MVPDRGKIVAEVFENALDCAPAERDAFLDSACQGDDALRNEVESLLDADARAEGFLASPVRIAPPSDAAVETPDAMAGRQIGRYRVVGIIASGGMGTVYEAVQEQPKRRVEHERYDPALPCRGSRAADDVP